MAFIVGYLMQDIRYTLYIGGGGLILGFLAVVPPWPVYNQNPVKWLPSRAMANMGISIQVDEKEIQ